MGIFIKNPETERKARELAGLRGETITGAIDQALEKALEIEHAKPNRKYSAAERRAATEAWRKSLDLDPKTWTPLTKAEWDGLWATGIAEIDDR